MPLHHAPGSEAQRRRRRGFAATAALAVVLAGLSAYTVIGTVRMTQAVQKHSRSLAVDAWFGEARNAIAVQEMETRHYQGDPSVATRVREEAAAASARNALEGIVQLGPRQSAADARRLLAAWVVYRQRTAQLIRMTTDGDPAARTFDRLEATPAYFTLKHDIDLVVSAYHAAALRQNAALRRDQIRLLVGTSVGYGAGLILISFIAWVMLADQRRLAEHADESELRSLHDELTGLPNRAMFHRKLDAEQATRETSPGRLLGVMLVDLNGFKSVNDTLGHAAGDELLVQSGRRLVAGVREGDLVARLGGDEFAVLLPELRSMAEAHRVAERLTAALDQEFLLSSGPVRIGGSVGVAVGPLHGTGEELLRHADAAMYRAKSAGGGSAIHEPLPIGNH